MYPLYLKQLYIMLVLQLLAEMQKNKLVITIVSAHRRILGLASVVCVLVKIRVSSISLYKLDTAN